MKLNIIWFDMSTHYQKTLMPYIALVRVAHSRERLSSNYLFDTPHLCEHRQERSPPRAHKHSAGDRSDDVASPAACPLVNPTPPYSMSKTPPYSYKSGQSLTLSPFMLVHLHPAKDMSKCAHVEENSLCAPLTEITYARENTSLTSPRADMASRVG